MMHTFRSRAGAFVRCRGGAAPGTVRAELIRFVLIGVAATIVHYGIYYAGIELHFPYNAAYTAGYLLSLAFNYTASVRFTFRTNFSARKALLFIGCHAVNYALHIALLNLFIAAGIPEPWAPLPVYAVVGPINFLLVRRALRGPDRKPSNP